MSGHGSDQPGASATGHEIEGPSSTWKSEHHIMPVSSYFKVFGALTLLTIITVSTAKGVQFHPHVLNIFLAMFIALIKALLVIMFFMHQKYETRMNRLIFVAGFFALVLFIGLTSSDLMTRRHFVQNPKVFVDLKKDEEARGLHPEGEVAVPQLPKEENIVNPSGARATDDKIDEPRPIYDPKKGEAGQPAQAPGVPDANNPVAK